jgi:hypothetical protein
MESLRTRRAKPRQPPKKPASGNVRKSTVDDRIKKRMSMRYADISLPTNLTDVPKFTPLPSSVRPQGREREQEQDEFVGERSSDPQAEAWAENIRTLERVDFDPDVCECTLKQPSRVPGCTHGCGTCAKYPDIHFRPPHQARQFN